MAALCNYQYNTFFKSDASLYVEKSEEINGVHLITLKESNELNIKSWDEYKQIWDNCLGVYFDFEFRSIILHEKFKSKNVSLSIKTPFGEHFPIAFPVFATNESYLKCKEGNFKSFQKPASWERPKALTKYPSNVEVPPISTTPSPSSETTSPQSTYSSIATTQTSSPTSVVSTTATSQEVVPETQIKEAVLAWAVSPPPKSCCVIL